MSWSSRTFTWICWATLLLQAHAFAPSRSVARFSIHYRSSTNNYKFALSSSTNPDAQSSSAGYVPPRQEEERVSTPKPLYPQVGDICRYYDLDGGREDGEVLVGKISFLQKQLPDGWLVELTELENVGDGYYAEYPSRKKQFKKATRPLESVSPIAASFVRSESAYKVPRNAGTEDIVVKAQQYTIEGFNGPFAEKAEMDLDMMQEDAELYGKLKFDLLRNAALAGVAGTLVADLTKGTEDAAIYAAGAAAGVGYLFFLSLKTDTLGSQDAKLGSNISNLRFVLPLIVLTGVAVYNVSAQTGAATGFMSTVTPEQFGAAILGFLTYRIPLFVSQLSLEGVLPGSAGVAMELANASEEAEDNKALSAVVDSEGLVPVLLVSGPPGTGKSTLVKRLVEESDGRFVQPKLVDRMTDGATFERLALREEFLEENERYGLTKEGILTAAAASDGDTPQAVVVDANVELAKKLTRIPGARLIGVWVGLDSMEKFEERLNQEIDSGEIEIPQGETRDSVIRAKIKEIVADIEYGVVSGVFEFTILNNDFDKSLEQLKFAAEYCFK